MTKWEDDEEKSSSDFWLFIICLGIFCLLLIMLIPLSIDQWRVAPQRVLMLDSIALMGYYLLVRLILWANYKD